MTTCSDDIGQSLINSEITEITHKIAALDTIREKLEQDLLRLQEDELELDDERTCRGLYFVTCTLCGTSGRCQGADRG